MKTLWKILGGIFLVGLLFVVGFAALVSFKAMPTYDAPEVSISPSTDSTSIAEGYRMAAATCMNCHSSCSGKLDGNPLVVEGAGDWYAPNLTRHPEYGLQYEPDELLVLLRTGIKKDGYLGRDAIRMAAITDGQ